MEEDKRISKTKALRDIEWACLSHVGDKSSLIEKIEDIIDSTKAPSRRRAKLRRKSLWIFD